MTARLNTGPLKVLPGACPNLLREASLYRRSKQPDDSELPTDAHNHALAPLRNLVMRLDDHQQARPKATGQPPRPARDLQRDYLWNNPNCWTRIL